MKVYYQLAAPSDAQLVITFELTIAEADAVISAMQRTKGADPNLDALLTQLEGARDEARKAFTVSP